MWHLNLRNIDTRIQLYIKSKAVLNIGSQAGINHLVTRYSDVYEVQRQFPLAGNIVKGETYLKDITKQSLLKGIPDKWESKTTTTLRYKSEMIDFFRKEKYKNMTAKELGEKYKTFYTDSKNNTLFPPVNRDPKQSK